MKKFLFYWRCIKCMEVWGFRFGPAPGTVCQRPECGGVCEAVEL